MLLMVPVCQNVNPIALLTETIAKSPKGLWELLLQNLELNYLQNRSETKKNITGVKIFWILSERGSQCQTLEAPALDKSSHVFLLSHACPCSILGVN